MLGPFQGKPACVRIPIGQGVCGAAAARGASVVVPDVHDFPGHIACDPNSRSELVVPLVEDGAVLGVLDLDSPVLARFDEADRDGCEQLVALFVAHHRRSARADARDIDPESGCRLPLPRREDLDEEGRRAYDRLADPDGGTLRGLQRSGRHPTAQPRIVAALAAGQPVPALRGRARRSGARIGDPRHRARTRRPVRMGRARARRPRRGHFAGDHRHHPMPRRHRQALRSRRDRHRPGPRNLRRAPRLPANLCRRPRPIRPAPSSSTSWH